MHFSRTFRTLRRTSYTVISISNTYTQTPCSTCILTPCSSCIKPPLRSPRLENTALSPHVVCVQINILMYSTDIQLQYCSSCLALPFQAARCQCFLLELQGSVAPTAEGTTGGSLAKSCWMTGSNV